MATIIKVGMADVKTCTAPDGVTTLGLGSCVGVAIRDPLKKVGGLAHIMLPSSEEIKSNDNPYKFADTGIDELVKMIMKLGGSRAKMEAKLAGGAQMFAFQNKNMQMRVGDRNVMACKKKLASLGIRVLAEDCGENFGRTVIFYPETGEYVIRSVGRPEKSI